MDYAIKLSSTNTIVVQENGNWKGGFGSVTNGDVLRIERTGSTITYKKNGTTFYTSSTPSTTSLLVDVCFYHSGGEINAAQLSFGDPEGTAPIAPSNLQGTIVSESVQLSWTDASDDEDGFRIERQADSGVFELLADLASNSTTYADNTVAAATTYTYRVYAYNTFGASEFSNTTELTMPPVDQGSSDNITWTDLVGVEVLADNTLRKTAPYGGNNGGALSMEVLQPYTDGWAEFTAYATNNERYFGLTETDAGPIRQMDYAIKLTSTNKIVVEESGTWKGGFEYVADGDVLRVERSGTTITYKRNGTVFYTSSLPSTTSLMVDVCFYHANGEINNGQASFDIPSADMPAAPSDLVAEGISSSEINLGWADNADNETGYEIERSLTSGSGYSLVHTTTADVTSYTDSGLSPYTTYFYRIRAVSGTTASGYTPDASATTYPEGHVTPGSPQAISLSSTSALVTWETVPGVTGYEIVRSQTVDSGYGVVGTAGSLESSFKNSVETNVAYYYKIRSVYSDGHSDYTTPVSVTAQPHHGTVDDDVEYAALKDLYESTGGESWARLTWPEFETWPEHVSSAEFRNWAGVEVFEGDVIQLGLEYNHLSGTLPASLGNLRRLKSLWLNYNEITGEVPQSIASLPELEALWLDHNFFSDLPTGLADIPTLGYVEVSYNDLGFEDLEQFFYAPGSPRLEIYYEGAISYPSNTMILPGGDALHIAVPDNAEHNQYQWFRYIGGSWVDITDENENPAGNPFVNTTTNMESGGQYACTVSNDWITGYAVDAYTTVTMSVPTPELHAVATDFDKIHLSWKALEGVSYQIERSLTAGSGYGHVMTTPPGAAEYTDHSLNASTAYYYRVKATYGSKASGYSEEASALTKTPVPTDNSLTYQARYNGNIAAIKWKSHGDTEEKLYTYHYDPMNRITKAQYSQGSSTLNNWTTTPAKGGFSVNNIDYDLNGNIQTLNRQSIGTDFRTIDALTYTYTNGNQLSAVADAVG
ncbi:Fibronectin, type III domain protein [Fulvivirga imtechensis AK7]|uniref:Fibronectin, type III domain protein n=1 Tax=Fulvivirga imtechensis AK7 TaxID=1237149 RepID=L8JH82_9BACT|nr:fibronectin type III domain-containing protein [Fulvivirga imtechensis]ELR68180.1 Fibronectin, type III domain protein [Fulvivirga imtechensis AK7]